MAHGLETRALSSTTSSRPGPCAFRSTWPWGRAGELKALLRAAARRIFGRAIADRPKRGFSIPVHAWIRGPLSELVRDLLSPRSVAGLVRVPRALTAVPRGPCRSAVSWASELWGLAVLGLASHARGPRPPDSPAAIEPPRAVIVPPPS